MIALLILLTAGLITWALFEFIALVERLIRFIRSDDDDAPRPGDLVSRNRDLFKK